MTKILALLLIGFSLPASAQTFKGVNSSIGGIDSTGHVGGIGVSTDKPKMVVETTMIGGTCVYKDTWCPGARAILKDSNGQVLQEALLTREGFKFGGLMDRSYTVIVEYPKYKFNAKVDQVSPGQVVGINFDRPN